MTDRTHGRFLLVELKDDLAGHFTTLNGIHASIMVIPGVKSITDVALFTAGVIAGGSQRRGAQARAGGAEGETTAEASGVTVGSENASYV